jgi:hypothetical protein
MIGGIRQLRHRQPFARNKARLRAWVMQDPRAVRGKQVIQQDSARKMA